MSTALSSSNPKHDDTATGSSSLAGNKRQAEDVPKAIKKVNDEIDEVNHQIKEIENTLKNKGSIWNDMDNADKQDYDNHRSNWVKELRDDKKQLRKDKEQLRDTLNKLLDKEKGLSNPTPAKKPCIDQTPKSKRDVFFSVVPKTTVNKGLVTFAKQILGRKDSSMIMYKRTCYDRLYNMIKANFRKAPRERSESVVVMGSPGTGKSFCALYVLYDLVRQGKTVLYVRESTGKGKGGSGYLYAPPDCPLLKRLRDDGYDIPESDPATNWVGVVKLGTGEGARFMASFQDEDDGYFILDPSKGGIMVPDTYHCKLIVFSSPHRESKNNVKNSCMLRFMPLWTLDELKEANIQCALGLDESLLENRFELFGGIARHVFCRVADRPQDELDRVQGKLTSTTAKELFEPMSNNTDQSGMLVHMSVDADTLKSYTTTIASANVLNMIAMHTISMLDFELYYLVRRLHGIGLPSAAGQLAELCFHKNLLHLHVGVWMWRELKDAAQTDAVMKQQEERLVLSSTPAAENDCFFSKGALCFFKQNLSDMSERWGFGHYCLPLISNFPTLDSFAVFRGSLFPSPSKPKDEKTTTLSLVGFQMTVAETHKLGLNGWKRVFDVFQDKFVGDKNVEVELYVVWVVEHGTRYSWNVKQKWTTTCSGSDTNLATEELDKTVRQIVLSKEGGAIYSKS